jgi:hypothetical protein
MRRALCVLAALLAAAVVCDSLFAGVDAHTWNAARRKFMKDKDDVKKLPELIDEMAQLDDKRAVETLCKYTLFHQDYDIRVKTFDALARTTDKDAVEFLAEQVRRQEKERLIYTRLLQYVSGEKVADNIKRAMSDKRWEVVTAALEAARKHADKSLLDELKKGLEDRNPRLAYEAALAYKACGGELPEKFKMEPTGGIFPAKIFSNRCLVLFDISDDMEVEMALPVHRLREKLAALKKEPKPEEYRQYFVATRQNYCAAECAAALATLDRSAEVNVMTFSIGSAMWQRKFEKFSKNDVEPLQKYLEKRMTRPARDLYEALRKAMSLEDVDTIFIVTCGLPAGARQEDTKYILSWLKEANYERSIKINTAVVLSKYLDKAPTEEQSLAYGKATEPVISFYKEMAAQNGGEFYSLTDHGRVPLTAAAPPKKEDKKEPKKEEPRKEEPEKKEPAKEEPAKKEPGKEEPKKEEPAKSEPEKKEEPKKEPEKKPGKGWLPGGG